LFVELTEQTLGLLGLLFGMIIKKFNFKKYYMYRFILVLLSLLSSMMLFSEDFKREVIKFEDYEKIIDKKDDTLYVVNFWASWCGPCVEELPDFMAVNDAMKGREDFKMILISLDEKEKLDKELMLFIEKHGLAVDIYILDELRRMNYWIPRVDKKWKGSIPATVFYRNGKKLHFVEKPLHQDELQAIVDKLLE
jgi:thiol-disulfide isomerase/thioredoxin